MMSIGVNAERAQFNLTQNGILEGMLTHSPHWTLLEKFNTIGSDEIIVGETERFNFTEDHFNGNYMKAFEWSDSVASGRTDNVDPRVHGNIDSLRVQETLTM